MKIELEKTKKEKEKQSKEFESKLITVNNELVKSYGKVDKIYKENVKLLEEKKVLQGIHKVNTDLHEKLKMAENKAKAKNFPNEKEKEDEDEVIEMMDLFINQRQNRPNRTNPTVEAEIPQQRKNKKNGAIPKHFSCIKCKFSTNSEVSLKDHIKTYHENNSKCGMCNFRGKSSFKWRST